MAAILFRPLCVSHGMVAWNEHDKMELDLSNGGIYVLQDITNDQPS